MSITMFRRCLAAVPLLLACQRAPHAPHRSGASDGAVTLSPGSRPYIQVERAAAPPAGLQRSLFARVSFDERRVAAIGSPVSGRVLAVHVVTGARVRAGDPLVTIRSTDLSAARAQAAETHQSRLLAAETAARARTLVAQGAGSLAEQQQAEAALALAVEEERRAASALGALGARGSSPDYVLRAPRAGTVVERAVQPGNAITADAGQALVTLADLSTVWVLADVFEQDVSAVRAGDDAVVTVSALEGRSFTGRVAYVGDVVDATTRAARARIELPNPDGALRPGMFAEVGVRSGATAAAFVPTTAVLARRDEFFVFVPTAAATFVARRVRIGSQAGEHVAILEGLRPGEEVVTRGAILLDAEANTAL